MSSTAPVEDTRSQRETWKRRIETMNGVPSVAGSVLATRDGLCVINECPRLRRPEVTAAMGAAILSACETIAGEMSLGRQTRVSMRAGGQTILALAATDDLMIIALLHAGADPDAAAAEIERILAATRRETPR